MTDKHEFDAGAVQSCTNAKDAMPDGGTLTIRARNVTERESQKFGIAVSPRRVRADRGRRHRHTA